MKWENQIVQCTLEVPGATMQRPVNIVRRSSRGRFLWLAGGTVALAVGAAIVWHLARPAARTAEPPAPIPVTVTAAVRRDVPVYLDGLGTVQALNTIAIHPQIDGKLQSVEFVEGREVHKGDMLAVIDPAPFKAALDQANAKKAQDEAQLIGADKDLTRFKDLAAKRLRHAAERRPAAGQGRSAQSHDRGGPGRDRERRVQLGYTTISAPIDGRVGFRQVDAGNIIHANDTDAAHRAHADPSDHGHLHPAASRTRDRARCDGARQGACRGLRPGRHAPAGRRRADAGRQPDRPDHQHDPPQGQFANDDEPSVAGRVRAHPRAGRYAQWRRDDTRNRAATRAERLLHLGGQAG